MTIDEAIKILEGSYYKHTILLAGKDDEALKLGIEALNYINVCRHNPNCFRISLLPGETEEEPPTREEVKKYMAELK